MTPPADLAALRALVEAVKDFWEETKGNARAERYNAENRAQGGALGPSAPPRWQARERLFALLPAAREALEELERVKKTRATPSPTNSAHDHGNCELCDWQEARLARLEKALRRVRAIVSPAIVGQHECDVIDAALEGRPHDANTAEWQRVHGPVIQGDAAVTSEASAQAARDAAYWRRRAEDAEARAVREGRDE